MNFLGQRRGGDTVRTFPRWRGRRGRNTRPVGDITEALAWAILHKHEVFAGRMGRIHVLKRRDVAAIRTTARAARARRLATAPLFHVLSGFFLSQGAATK